MPRKNARAPELPGRTRQREQLRRSNAAGPHKQLRKDEEIPDQQEDDFDDVEFGLFDWLGKDLDPDA